MKSTPGESWHVFYPRFFKREWKFWNGIQFFAYEHRHRRFEFTYGVMKIQLRVRFL